MWEFQAFIVPNLADSHFPSWQICSTRISLDKILQPRCRHRVSLWLYQLSSYRAWRSSLNQHIIHTAIYFSICLGGSSLVYRSKLGKADEWLRNNHYPIWAGCDIQTPTASIILSFFLPNLFSLLLRSFTTFYNQSSLLLHLHRHVATSDLISLWTNVL